MSIDKQTVFEKTPKGINESKGRWGIFADRRQKILALIDGKTTVENVIATSGMKENRLMPELEALLQERLIRESYIPAGQFTINAPEHSRQGIYVTVADTQAFMEALEKQKPSETEADEEDLISLADIEEKLQQEAEQLAAREEVERQLQIEARVKEEAERLAREEAERKAKAEAEHAAREEAQRQAREEEARQVRAEAERQAQEAAERAAREEAARQAKEEEARRVRAEAERKAQEAAERAAREETERLAKEEAARRASEEAERKAMEEAERAVREEAERVAREEEARRVHEEAERKAKEAAERAAREEAERKTREERIAKRLKAREEEERRAREEAERKAKEDAERIAREEAERQAKEEEERRAREEVERAAREEAERLAQEEAERRAREEAEQLAREEAERAAREEAERQAREEEERRALEEAEQLAREEAERAAREEAERLAREEEERRAREEAERLAREEAERAAREEAERLAREEEERRAREEAEHLAREEAERAAREEAERAAREEAERLAREEEERRAHEEAEQLAREEAERAAREEVELLAREEEERRAREEAEQLAREEAERAASEEAERLAQEEDERAAREEVARIAKEAEARRAREEAERKAQDEAERLARKEAQRQAKADEARRAREEAERKAQEKAERKAREAAEKVARKEAMLSAREEREPGESGDRKAVLLTRIKWGAAGLVALLVLAGVGINFVPLGSSRTQLEKLASTKLGEPVKIQSMHVVLLPSPHLKLDQVRIGSQGDSRIAVATIYAGWGTLLGSARKVERIELEKVDLAPGMLETAAGWPAKNAQQQPAYQVARVTVRNLKIAASDPAFPAFRGDFDFSAAGRLDKASLASEDGALRADFAPAPEGGLGVSVSASDIAPLYFLPVKISSLHATAKAGDRSIRFDDLSGSVSGGKVSGSLTLSWDAGWSAAGDVRIAGANIAASSAKPDSPIVSGKLDAAFSFLQQATMPEQLLRQPLLTGSVTLRDGAVTGFDLAETLHYAVEAIYIGQTPFDVWSFRLEPSGDRQGYRVMRMAGKGLLVEGYGEVSAKGALSGAVKLSLEEKKKTMRGNYRLDGTLARPAIHRAK
ncbi:hypothetical protein SKTS_27320 [Sulfurimicrobium lacus]|uniref:AsmA-like C-terminal domain-containing protein n=1 Tax=Sulfurimicrobium lacus TaxID=2715678 RepID=A0A6F8VFP4_9PROT|nr:hypothetical protein [Sulfurimicrobium lacus]BCB27846.1 hypothetical protein SKTS_27320 [Sulfurimicrobium lacus]